MTAPIDLESLRGILKDEQQGAQMEGPLTDEELVSLSEHCCYPDGILDRVIAEHDAQPAPELCGIMRTDTEYLRGLSENQNLPTLMRDTLRNAAAEIDRLHTALVAITNVPVGTVLTDHQMRMIAKNAIAT